MTRQVPLASLLALHERHRDATPLYENLGDGALFQGNQVFRAIRTAALARGAKFTTEDPEGYLAWPLVALPALLTSGVIPYRRTRLAFARLEATRPGHFQTADAELIEPPTNAVLHEAAHLVADREWTMARPVLAKLSDAHRVVLRHALGEAFANASELAAMAYTASAEEDWFLAYNSYWAPLPKLPPAWQRLCAGIGSERAARWLILGFLQANLLTERLSDAALVHMRALAGLTGAPRGAEKADLGYLAEEALSLNLVFRTNTAKVFYASVGLTQTLPKLMRFDALAAIEAEPALHGLLGRLASLLVAA
jgi:hypothetical protein